MIETLMKQFPRSGKLVWIGIRPGRGAPMISVAEAAADSKEGLIGDRYAGRSGKRQATLIQREHIPVLESLTGKKIAPEILRRNLVVEGINLLALKGQKFRIGEAVFKATGLCHPCSRMEAALGPGGYNAMRGHGGLTATILLSGTIRLGDDVAPIFDEE
ncbi:MAG: MOSC domain-containing protein [Gammaproteobacteria bacterium]